LSDELISSNQSSARPFMSRGVTIYFGILFALTFIALLPGAITIGILFFILPGLILLASSTLLFYSIALLPAYFINRFSGKRLLAAAVAAISLAAAALLPHYGDEYRLGRLVAADHSEPPTSFEARSFELPYPEGYGDWTNWRRPESRDSMPPPPCADLCQQLLFKGHVDQVVMPEHLGPDPLADGSIVIGQARAFRLGPNGSVQEIPPLATAPNPRTFFRPKWRRFRLERRETCPDPLSLIEEEFVREVIGGRCLIEDTIDSGDADAVLSIDRPRGQNNPSQNIEQRGIQTGPTTVTITEFRDHRAIPVEVKTTLVARYATAPFYLTGTRCGGGEIPKLCLVAATLPFPSSFADPFEMIGRRYGLAIAQTPWSSRFSVAVSDDDRAAVGAILKQDYGADGYIPMTPSRLVASFIDVRLKSGQLNQDDIELIRALLRQPTFALSIESNLPLSTYQALKPLLPEMVERIAYSPNGQDLFVQSLDIILDHFSAEEIDPYLSALCGQDKHGNRRLCYRFRNAHKR
jgi:hypothetical protein